MTRRALTLDALDAVRFQDQSEGPALVPVVTQDATTGNVLMLAWADRTALEASLATGAMHYWSRSRKALWQKGETSGHTQSLRGLYLDCDADAVLAVVDQTGAACHTEATTCWHEDGTGTEDVSGILGALQEVLADRAAHPKEGSYTNRLLADENLRLKKVAEEAGEFLIAAAKHDKDQAVYEAGDLLYHLLVVLESEGVSFSRVLEGLRSRQGRET